MTLPARPSALTLAVCGGDHRPDSLRARSSDRFRKVKSAVCISATGRLRPVETKGSRHSVCFGAGRRLRSSALNRSPISTTRRSEFNTDQRRAPPTSPLAKLVFMILMDIAALIAMSPSPKRRRCSRSAMAPQSMIERDHRPIKLSDHTQFAAQVKR